MKAFFAYPAANHEVRSAILGARTVLSSSRSTLSLEIWEENDISGRSLTDPIFEKISNSDFLIADITFINFNVTFEIGYAIGCEKRVYLVRNSNFVRDGATMDKIGIFDTLGFESYSDAHSLANFISTQNGANPNNIRKPLNTKSPVYILQTPQSSSGMLAINSRVKKARLGYRGFQPSDESRLSAPKAIDDIAACLGAIVPLVPPTFADALIHNTRAAFVAGLALGMSKICLILQPPDGPAPLDVRDIITSYSDASDIADSIGAFALDVTERLQSEDPLPLPSGDFLSEVSIGDAVAENELQTLSRYYLPTDQFKRASRGEVNLVVGRKGAGKTALFSQLRNQLRNNIKNIVVDLKPEGYQLIRLKEDVLDYLADGAKSHLITALFEYVFYLEICYKVLEKDREKHKRDARLFDPYIKLQEIYQEGSAGEGDFSERLQAISRALVLKFRDQFGKEENQRLTAAQVTELIHKQNIRELRDALSRYLNFKDGVWLLFDNLDKGWSSQGLTDNDILILRCLIDAARKIQHQMQAGEHTFYSIVFVRNDVYQLLVEKSADYGKESRAVLDWTDSEMLREVLRRRLIAVNLPAETPFERVWQEVCISHYGGEESSQYLIDRSLMRPRNLIKLFGHCRSFAVGLGKSKIGESEIEKGLRAYSLDLITEADQELTDILGDGTNLMYYFVGEGSEFSKERIYGIIKSAGIDEDRIEDVVNFLLYYGFIGLKIGSSDSFYIFDVGYDMKMLQVRASKAGENLVFSLSPAFDRALN